MPKKTRRQKRLADTRRHLTVLPEKENTGSEKNGEKKETSSYSAYSYAPDKQHDNNIASLKKSEDLDFSPIRRELLKTTLLAIIILIMEIGLIIRFR